MAIVIKEDLIEGAYVETEGLVQRAVRVFYLSGITVNPDQKYETLYQATTASGIPQYGDRHPSRTALIVTNIRVDGTSGDSVRLIVKYESNQFSEPSSYIITDDGYTEKYQTTFVPGTRQLITVSAEVKFNVSVDIGGGTTSSREQTETITDEPVVFLFDRHIRQITVHRLIYGSLNPDAGFDGPYTGKVPTIGQKLAGQVNRNQWLGDPQGYWKLQRFKTDVSRYSGYYTKEVSAITKNDEDWSEYGILRSKMTGNYIKPDDAALSAVAGLPYDFGIIGKAQSDKKGFRRVGPGQLLDFATIFGF